MDYSEEFKLCLHLINFILGSSHSPHTIKRHDSWSSEQQQTRTLLFSSWCQTGQILVSSIVTFVTPKWRMFVSVSFWCHSSCKCVCLPAGGPKSELMFSLTLTSTGTGGYWVRTLTCPETRHSLEICLKGRHLVFMCSLCDRFSFAWYH